MNKQKDKKQKNGKNDTTAGISSFTRSYDTSSATADVDSDSETTDETGSISLSSSKKDKKSNRSSSVSGKQKLAKTAQNKKSAQQKKSTTDIDDREEGYESNYEPSYRRQREYGSFENYPEEQFYGRNRDSFQDEPFNNSTQQYYQPYGDRQKGFNGYSENYRSERNSYPRRSRSYGQSFNEDESYGYERRPRQNRRRDYDGENDSPGYESRYLGRERYRGPSYSDYDIYAENNGRYRDEDQDYSMRRRGAFREERVGGGHDFYSRGRNNRFRNESDDYDQSRNFSGNRRSRRM